MKQNNTFQNFILFLLFFYLFLLFRMIVNYKFNSKVTAFVAFNNLFNVYPDTIDTKGDFVTDLGGRFKYPWEVNQFGFNGTIINGGVSFSF